MRIALAGNPNSGKTTMYNALTGSSEKVGNWAGVTVDKKEHPIKKAYAKGAKLIAVDLPGAYSMSPFTSEESVTSSYVKKENPDVIINIVDGTNLSRSLFFTTQLLELGIPVVVALNKSDVNEKKETKIDVDALSKKLGCPVVTTVSTSAKGLKTLIATASSLVGKPQKAPYCQGDVDLSDRAAVEAADRKRFEFVNGIVKEVESRKVFTKERNFGDKIDNVLTNKWLGIPIFAVVMVLVFYISQVTLGPWIAEGYTFERDDILTVTHNDKTYELSYVEEEEAEEEAENTPDAALTEEEVAELIKKNAMTFVGEWESEGVKLEFADDYIFTMTAEGRELVGTYDYDMDEELISIALEDGSEITVEYDSRDIVIPGLVTFIEMFGEWVAGLMENSAPILQTIVVDGIIGGVGAVIGFLPLVMVMYFLLALLEDCGYMARVAVVLDPIFKKVGLSGKSVIPIVMGTGCAIPGIMACRTIRDERERRATAMLTPFIPCGAKIPVIALLAGLFFPGSVWVAPLMYFLGLALIFLGALLIKVITGYKHRKSYFIIELPEYKAPSVLQALKSMCQRGWSYIVKAGTIILLCNAVVTILSSYSWSLKAVDADASILHDIASPFALILIPLGFGMWQLAAAAITGFIAKEEVVGTLGAVFATLAVNADFELLQSGFGESVLGISAVAGLSYLMFNLFTPPCFAAIGAMNSEIKSKKWLFAGIGLQFATAYVLSFLVYQLGTLFTEGALGTGFVPGLIAVIVIIWVVVLLSVLSNRKAKKAFAGK